MSVACELRLGRWQDVLEGERGDHLITDPPYGESTHRGQPGETTQRDLDYSFWCADDVRDFVGSWAPRIAGWLCCMTSDDLIDAYRSAYAAHGLKVFAPVPIIQERVRQRGDGPASCAVYLMVARPRREPYCSWGALPGWYHAGIERNAPIVGAKPVPLLSAVLRDYSRKGDRVIDPCAGWGSTLMAAHAMGRGALGAEAVAITYGEARKRLDTELRQGLLGLGTPGAA